MGIGASVEYKKALLGAASILALTAAVENPAEASISRGAPQESTKTVRMAEVASDLYSDPLFELLARTNGSVTGDVLENAISEMFSNPSVEKVSGFPEFLSGIATLGAAPDAMERAKETLIAIIAASDLNDEARDALIARMEASTRPVLLAQVNRRRDPDTTGQVGPGGGGYL